MRASATARPRSRARVTAKAAFQKAIDSGHPDYAASAELRSGALLAGQGDAAGAKAAFQKVIDSLGPIALLDRLDMPAAPVRMRRNYSPEAKIS